MDDVPAADNIIQKIIPYKVPLLLGGGSIICVIISLIFLVKSFQTSSPIQFISNQDIMGDSTQASISANPSAPFDTTQGKSSGQVSKKMIHVDIEGGVRAPGLYILPVGSRIDDAIAKAGGLSEEADKDVLAKQLNRASVLVDGAKIYIPKVGDSTSYINSNTLGSNTTSDNILINVNTSSQNQLESLPGVGPATAKKIIDNRPYQTLEELVNKKAVGSALFEKIRTNLSL